MTTTNAGNRSPLGALILLWLLTKSKDRAYARLTGALTPLLEHRRSPAEQRDAIDGELDSLE